MGSLHVCSTHTCTPAIAPLTMPGALVRNRNYSLLIVTGHSPLLLRWWLGSVQTDSAAQAQAGICLQLSSYKGPSAHKKCSVAILYTLEEFLLMAQHSFMVSLPLQFPERSSSIPIYFFSLQRPLSHDRFTFMT